MYDEVSTEGVLMPLKFQIKKYFEQSNNLNTALNLFNSLISYPESITNFSMSNFI